VQHVVERRGKCAYEDTFLMKQSRLLDLITAGKCLSLSFSLTREQTGKTIDVTLDEAIETGGERPTIHTSSKMVVDLAQAPDPTQVSANWQTANQNCQVLQAVQQGEGRIGDNFQPWGMGEIGRFTCATETLNCFTVISARDVTPSIEEQFNIKVIRPGEPSPKFTWDHDGVISVLTHQNNPGKMEYVSDFVLQLEGGNGIYLETHKYEHFFIPASCDSVARIMIGRQVGHTTFEFYLVVVEYGLALMLGGYVIHNSSASHGDIAVAFSSNDTSADIVLMRDANGAIFDCYQTLAENTSCSV